jgi:hypothetical protein
MTPSGIEPATFLLLAQCLNHLRHRVPQTFVWVKAKYMHVICIKTSLYKIHKVYKKYLPVKVYTNKQMLWVSPS